MFVGLVVASCMFTGEGNSDPTSSTTTSKFDVRRAMQWIFGKRSSPTKAPAMTPDSKTAGDLEDSRTELRCRSNVFGDPALRATGMTVKVVDGIAYLEGVATSRWHRLRAEQLAQSTPGVLRVENQLRLEEGEASSSRPQAAAGAVPKTADAQTVEPVSAENPSPSVVVSRPKSLPNDSDEPAVTTYTIRRSGNRSTDLQNASAETKPGPKRSDGRLVPWNEGPATGNSAWLESLGMVSTASLARPKEGDASGSLEPLDLAVQRILSASLHANELTFDREGGNVVLKGAAPAAAKFRIAFEVGRIPGVGTVSIESGVAHGF